MKKFLLGLVSGVVLSFSTAAVASNTIQAYLFPTKVTVYSAAGIKTIDGTGNNAVLNYNNKAYIPLRTFTDAMGAKLEYQPASAANGNKHQIKIFDPSLQQALKLRDKGGYVSFGQFVYNEQNGLTGATIQIHKDLTGKEIEIRAKDADGQDLSTEYVYIDSEKRTLQPGEFHTVRISSGGLRQEYEDSYEVVVHDLLKLTDVNQFPQYFQYKPIHIIFGPRNYQNPYSLGGIVYHSLTWINTSPDNIDLDPTPLEITVTKGDLIAEGEVILKKTHILQGKVPSGFAYHVKILWDQKDGAGQQVPPGHYIVSVKMPDQITYVKERTKQKEQWKTEYYQNLHNMRVDIQ